MIEAFPLAWPGGYPRTLRRSRAQFKTTFTQSRDGVLKELRLLGATHAVISSNIPLRRDGLPYAGMAEPQDPGIAVYFFWKGKQMVLACDRWDRTMDNLRAIEKAIDSMRGLERWGVSDMLNRAFSGFTALPPPETDTAMKRPWQPWWSVLRCDSSWTLDAIEDAYRRLAKEVHPDQGGSHAQMADLNRAIGEARAAKGKSA
jgi:hypothetical protein